MLEVRKIDSKLVRSQGIEDVHMDLCLLYDCTSEIGAMNKAL